MYKGDNMVKQKMRFQDILSKTIDLCKSKYIAIPEWVPEVFTVVAVTTHACSRCA